MTELPFMPMYWERFFGDVGDWPTEMQGVYAVLLGRMWVKGGWVKADDHYVARLIGVDVRVWRSRYKPAIEPLLRREIEAHVGDIYTQKRLTSELSKAREVVAKNKARTAAATAARTGKSTVKSSKASTVTSTVTKPNGEHRDVDRDAARSEAHRARVPEPHEPPSKGEGGSGPPYPHGPAGALAKGRAPTGPFMPSPPSPPRPRDASTAFTRRWERYQAGDAHALDPHPELPNNAATIRQRNNLRSQLGLDLLKEPDHDAAQAQADAHDAGEFREPEQPASGFGPASGQAGQGDGDGQGRAAAAAAGPADQREPAQDDPVKEDSGNERPDDDLDDLIRF